MNEQAYSLPVYKTEDYSIFKKLSGNRELYHSHILRLVKLLDTNPEFTRLNPIKVNEKMEVIDGQHRLASFEKYRDAGKGVPSIYYTIINGMTLADARELNAGSKSWLPKDYAQAYAETGNEHYKFYLKCYDEYKLNHHVLLMYLSGENSHNKEFNQGMFKVKNNDVKDKLDNLVEIGQYFKDYKLRHFGIALYQLMSSSKYNHERMVEQIKNYGDGLENLPARMRETVPAINMVYNWKRKDKVNLLS